MGNTSSGNEHMLARDKNLEMEKDVGLLAKVMRAEKVRKEAIATNKHDSIKENQKILKKLFKQLDPLVSRVDSDVRGEVQVSLKYDTKSSNLLVNVIKCRDLGLYDLSGKTAQPYVELFLHPDPKNIGMKQTSISSNPQNPAFNEKFVFPINTHTINETKLALRAFDYDLVNDDDELLGEVVISLSDFDFAESSVHTAWYTLQPETDLLISGELEVSLKYSLPQNLAITIHKATNLKINPEYNSCNPVVKIGIPGIDQIDITKVKTNDPNPTWEEEFTFDVPQEEFSTSTYGSLVCKNPFFEFTNSKRHPSTNDKQHVDPSHYPCNIRQLFDNKSVVRFYRYVVMTILDNRPNGDSLLGHVVIDLNNLTPDHGYRGCFALSDLSHSDRLRNKWHQTTQVQEFREALWAHSFFNLPNMIFQNHSGKKVIRVTCKDTSGAKAKLHLRNGIPVA